MGGRPAWGLDMSVFARGCRENEPDDGGRLARQATASLSGLLAERRMSRTDLAKAMGVSPGRVSQILSGDANITMRTLASVAEAVGARVEITFSDPAAGSAGALDGYAPEARSA